MTSEKTIPVLICALILIGAETAAAQGIFGVGISYGAVHAASADLYFAFSVHSFHLGGTLQFPDARGKPLEDASGHGAVPEGTGSFIWSVDAGYGYYLREYLPVNAVLSAGRRVHYTNYLDSGFTDGGFHTIDEKKIAIGVGGDVGYNFRGLFEIYAGYHTLRSFYIGIRVPIPDFAEGSQ